MKPILVCGHVNLETAVPIHAFPIAYEPVRYHAFRIHSRVAGVGYNIARALQALGNNVKLLSLVGQDVVGTVVQQKLREAGLSTDYVLPDLSETGQSVILYDQDGRRQIHTDLKDVQQRPYPVHLFQEASRDCDLVILCNVNYTRPLLTLARQAGKRIATDVHTIADLEDEYNRDYMAAAHILFMSSEHLPCAPEEWARRLQNRYGSEIVVIGLGAEGALLAVKNDNVMERVPSVQVRPVVNTVGAGDALFAAFNHVYHQTGDPLRAIHMAVLFASYKIGESGAAEGFLGAAELAQLAARYTR